MKEIYLKSKKSIRVISVIIIIFLIFSTGSTTYYINRNYKEVIDKDAENEMYSEATLIGKVINEFQNQALGVAISISKMEQIRKAYMTTDSVEAIEMLNSTVQPLISEIKSTLGFEKYKVHFHKAPATSFLREWNQTGGDDLSWFRNTILHVYQNQQPLKCIELGKGGFAIRGIAPIMNINGSYLGSVEVFFEILDIFPYLKSEFKDYNFYVIARKDYIDKVFFKKEIEKYSQGSVGNYVIIENTIPDCEISPEYLINNGYIETSMNEDSLTVTTINNIIFSCLSIKDFANENVGNIVFLFDRSKRLQLVRQQLIVISIMILGLGLILIVFIVILLKRMGKNLNSYNLALEKSLKEENEAKIAAELADKSKSEFLANMSHEIRTPLNAVLGYSEILVGKINDKSHLDYIEGIIASGKSLLGIINDILDLSKIEAGRIELNMEPSNPHKIIDELKKVFGIKIEEKGLYFKINVDENLPDSLVIDNTRLRQVLFNLIGNAIKFTSEGGITVNVKSEERIDDLTLSTVNLCFEIIDTGIGIDEEQLATIFDAFIQQKGQSIGKYGGTGLGLTISKRLTEMMNGNIKVKSKKGEGSSFTLTLDKVNIAAISLEDHSTSILSDIKLKKGTILLVEDIESNRKVVKGFLEEHDIKIIEAVNGLDGVEKAVVYLPDVILMDIHMPVMNGFDASKRIKEDTITSNIPIIALTASVFKHQEDSIKKVCNGYLRKPVSKKMLINELGKYLEYEKTETFIANDDKISTAINEKATNFNIDGDIEIIKNSAELSKVISEGLKEKYDFVIKGMSVNKIKEFAIELEDFAKNNNLLAICSIAESIIQKSEMFDIPKVKVLLNKLKQVFET